MVGRWEVLRKAADEFERKLLENSKIKVVFFVRKGGGFVDTAKVASGTLKRDGYRSDVWIGSADSVSETIIEFGKEFPGALASMEKMRAGYCHRPVEEVLRDGNS